MKNISTYTESTDKIVETFIKNIHLVTLSMESIRLARKFANHKKNVWKNKLPFASSLSIFLLIPSLDTDDAAKANVFETENINKCRRDNFPFNLHLKVHCKKGYRFFRRPPPAGMSLTKFSLAGNN